MSKVIYHAYFVNNIRALRNLYPMQHVNPFYHHATIAFKPKDLSNLQRGKIVQINICGILITDKVQCLIVEGEKLKQEFPHITLSTAEGVKPQQCNDELREHQDKIIWFPDKLQLDCTEGFFDGQDRK